MSDVLAELTNNLVRIAVAIRDELDRSHDFASDLQPVISMILNTLNEAPAPAAEVKA